MATKTKTAKKTRRARKPKVDAYTKVTNAMIEALEGDLGSWTKPWKVTGLHMSGNSGKAYRGANQWILFVTAMIRGYESNLWLTFKQAQALVGEGEKVLKGDKGEQKGTTLVFYKFGDKTDKETKKPVLDSNGNTTRVLLYATTFTVFNVEQTMVPAEKFAKFTVPTSNPNVANPVVEQFIDDTGADIQRRGDTACYIPSLDCIQLPPLRAFEDAGSFYATATHELTHWTGAKSRLDRGFGTRFGSQAYAAEELVAEMGSAFLCAEFGIEGKLQHPEYLKNWLTIMKADNKALFTASSAAQKAADYLKEAAATGASAREENEAQAA